MIVCRAYAKINWCLQVEGRRTDGYHLLNMINQPIDLFDDLSFEPARNLTLEVDGAIAAPVGNDNLVLRAAMALRQRYGTQNGAKIRLTKRIPTGAGLGGGSADAACALKALNELWSLGASTDELSALALTLGADVPFCLLQKPALVSGIGERLQELPAFPTCWLVIAKPEQGLSTKAVFSRYAGMGISHADPALRKAQLVKAVDALIRGDFGALKDTCGNDLQPAAISMLHEIEPLICQLYQFGAAYAQMSGAGSTVFGAFPQFEAASQAAERMRNHAPFVAVVAAR